MSLRQLPSAQQLNRAIEVGARFRSEERDLATLAASILGRDWHTAFEVLRPRRRTAHALTSISDPMPLLMSGRLARIRRLRARMRSSPDD